MAQLVEALRYKSEGRGFDSRWCHWHNPSDRTMALGSTQPLTEMSTRNISWGVKAAGAYSWQPYHLHVPIVLKSGRLNILEPSRPVQACNGIALPLCLHSSTYSWLSAKLNTNITSDFWKLRRRAVWYRLTDVSAELKFAFWDFKRLFTPFPCTLKADTAFPLPYLTASLSTRRPSSQPQPSQPHIQDATLHHIPLPRRHYHIRMVVTISNVVTVFVDVLQNAGQHVKLDRTDFWPT